MATNKSLFGATKLTAEQIEQVRKESELQTQSFEELRKMPFLKMTNARSYEVTEGGDNYIEGAKNGDFIDTVDAKAYDGKAGVLVSYLFSEELFLMFDDKLGGIPLVELYEFDKRFQLYARSERKGKGVVYTYPDPTSNPHDPKYRPLRRHRRLWVTLIDPETLEGVVRVIDIKGTGWSGSKELLAAANSATYGEGDDIVVAPGFAGVIQLTRSIVKTDHGPVNTFKATLVDVIPPEHDLYVFNKEQTKKLQDDHERLKQSIMVKNKEISIGTPAQLLEQGETVEAEDDL